MQGKRKGKRAFV